MTEFYRNSRPTSTNSSKSGYLQFIKIPGNLYIRESALKGLSEGEEKP